MNYHDKAGRFNKDENSLLVRVESPSGVITSPLGTAVTTAKVWSLTDHVHPTSLNAQLIIPKLPFRCKLPAFLSVIHPDPRTKILNLRRRVGVVDWANRYEIFCLRAHGYVPRKLTSLWCHRAPPPQPIQLNTPRPPSQSLASITTAPHLYAGFSRNNKMLNSIN